ncbi:hypothetical protein XA68_14885 [Ophiocordyceps unilateralis]|uniref:Uncharacterized protein n=1 Tax=Ophiocordyceps unilateralis TaxID=268505 RepID=A0A2A9P7Z0_OPHUN|nr:hypothetical protein XA68_14885 [Ophiocordyceps unilateralis]
MERGNRLEKKRSISFADNRRRVQIALYARSDHSFGPARHRGGYESYHWAILVSPKRPRGKDVDAYDVTDNVIVDPETHKNLNPSRQFYLQIKRGVTPTSSTKLVGRVSLCKLKDSVTQDDLEAIIRRVPIPNKLANPPQSCVTWARNAIAELQDAGLLRSFDLDKFSNWALRFADKGRSKLGTSKQYEHVVEYGEREEKEVIWDTEPYDDYVEYIYLVTSRTTEEIHEAKGIFPQGYSPYLSASGEAPVIPDLDVPFGGAIDMVPNTAYLRAYKRFGTAGMIAINRAGSEPLRIWKIKTTQNMIPENSIGGFWSEEEAFLILGGVHLGQMRGYYEIDVMRERVSGRFRDTHRPPHPSDDPFHENLLYRKDIFAKEQHIRLSELTLRHKANLRGLLLLPACRTPPLHGPLVVRRTAARCAWTDDSDAGTGGLTTSVDDDLLPSALPDYDSMEGLDGETIVFPGLRMPMQGEMEPMDDEEMTQLVNRLAMEETLALMDRLGFHVAVTAKETLDGIFEFRLRMRRHRAIESSMQSMTMPAVTSTPAVRTRLWGATAAMSLAALPFYFRDVAGIFHTKMRIWDQVAVAMSIVPVIGCAAQTVADAQNGMVPVLPSMLCFVGDILLFTTASLMGLLVRSIGALMEEEEKHGVDYILLSHDQGWNEHFDQVKAYLDSAEWTAKMTSQFLRETALIVFAVAEQKSLLEASKLLLQRNGVSDRERKQAEQVMDALYNETLRTMCVKIRERKRWFQMDLPLGVVKWVRDQAQHYNDEFLSRYRAVMEKEYAAKVHVQSMREGRFPVHWQWKEKQRREFEDKVDDISHHVSRRGSHHFNESVIIELVRSYASRELMLPSECSCVTEVYEVERILDEQLLWPEKSLAETLSDQLSCSMSSSQERVIIRLLTTGRLDANAQDDNGNTALTRASAQGNVGVVRAVLKSGMARLNLRNHDGDTALLLAAGAGHANIVEMLGNQVWKTERRMDMNVRSRDGGDTALTLAAENMDEEVVKKLMLTGHVLTELVNHNNESALDIAERKGYHRIARLIRQRAAIYVDDPPPPDLNVFPWTSEPPVFWPRRAVELEPGLFGGGEVAIYRLNTGERWRNDTGQFWDEESEDWVFKEGVATPDLSMSVPSEEVEPSESELTGGPGPRPVVEPAVEPPETEGPKL